MEARVLDDFIAAYYGEIDVKKGEDVTVIDIEGNPAYYKIRKGDRVGSVKADRLKLAPHEWYIPKCSRLTATQLLQSCNDGAFIVRATQSVVGEFSLSVKAKNEIIHFRIFHVAGEYYLEDIRFNSVNALIAYYRVSTTKDGVRLREIVQSQNGSVATPIKTEVTFQEPTRHYLPSRFNGFLGVATLVRDAEEPDELSIRVGDQFIILGEEDQNWLYAERIYPENIDGLPPRGLVPAVALKITRR